MRLYVTPELTAEQIAERNEALLEVLPHIEAQARFRARPESREDLMQDAAELFLRLWPRHSLSNPSGPAYGCGPAFAAAVAISDAHTRARRKFDSLKRRGGTGPLGAEECDRIDENTPEPWELLAVREEAERMLQALDQADPDLAATLRIRCRQDRFVRFDLTAVRRVRELFEIPEPPPVPTEGERQARRVEERRRRYDEMKERAAELLNAGFGQIRTAKATGLSRNCVRLLIASRRRAAATSYATRQAA